MHCLTANCVSTPIFATPDAASLVGQYTSLVLDASGFPVVSYWDQASGALKVLHCGDANCTGGANVITSPDTAGSTGLWTSITLDGSGFPVVSYSDATNGDLKVLQLQRRQLRAPATPSPPWIRPGRWASTRPSRWTPAASR